jgi:hypothetical protein
MGALQERSDPMQRREFLGASVAVAAGLAVPSLSRAAEEPASRLLFELRTYHFASSDKQKAFARFLAEAGVPAFNRAGVEPVGVFELLAKDNPKLKTQENPNDLYVLLPHKSFDALISFESRLQADGEYQKAGHDILSASKSDPTYARYESLLLLAMEGFPRIQVPAKSPTRIFELRTYENPNNERALNKLEMFNKGEFPVFARAGMPGVFFGGAVAGCDLPQLTYMIVPDLDDVKKNWAAFSGDPEWKRLSGDPSYKDNVSKVINLFIRPTEASQI